MGEFTKVNTGERNPKSVLEFSMINNGKEYVGHPTQKPVEMLKYLLRASSREGEIVLDPFMGSGSTAVACQQLGRKFIGFELDPQYIEMCQKRLAQKSLIELEAK
jgi:site-specific DNA-methyltransferase (adenine-specific)